ncbi:hypothetical protein EDF66_101112 [Sphingobacterium sp. JUb20]|nr:hypothetical protein [Sphingobacterium sp. JUb21]TCR10299.1 hypothetical protein EDF66_101112 [Sphingobacterium sp. JUb20]
MPAYQVTISISTDTVYSSLPPALFFNFKLDFKSLIF